MTREELRSRIHTTINNKKLDDQLKEAMVMTLVDEFVAKRDNDLANIIHKVASND